MAAPDRPGAPAPGAARDVVTVAGPDAETYLQSQVSQDLRGQAVGERRWTFVLAPNGRVEALAGCTRTGEASFELDTDPGFGEVLRARIERFKIRVQVETSLRTATAEPTADEEHARVAAAWPRMGAEIVPGETIPAETGITDVAVSFTKGCYPGQELVERMDSRAASAPRSLRRVVVAPGTSPGDPLLDDDGAEIGTVTSVSGTDALALVRRGSRADP